MCGGVSRRVGYDPLNVCGQGYLDDVPCGEDGVEVMYCLPASSLYSHQAVALWGKGDLRFTEYSGLQFTALPQCSGLTTPRLKIT